MVRKYIGLLAGAAIAAALIGLFALPKLVNPNRKLIAQFNKAGIGCIGVNQKVMQHIHPRLRIIADGLEETISAGIGDYLGCIAELHTHDASGTIHVESPAAAKTFYLKNFFDVWGRSLERAGYTLSMMVDGQPNQELGNLILRDNQEIILEYKKV